MAIETVFPKVNWDRVSAAPRGASGGLLFGWMLIIGALVILSVAALGASEYGGGAILAALAVTSPFAGTFLFVGMWIVSVCMILREIRQSALDAALHNGQAKIEGDKGVR